MFSRRLSRQLGASLGITRASLLFQATRHEDVEKKEEILQSCWQRQGWQVGVAIAFGISSVVGQPCDRTLAQLTPDTAPERNLGTVVSPLNPEIDLITGGTRPQNGSNIFHSFSEFNVNAGRGVYFDNPDGLINIFSRVTGNNASSIFGVLGVGQPGAVGTANLFLINPNGIIFGQGARLDLGGSFVGTTANAIQFPGGGEFSVNSTVDSGNPLLTVNPSAFFFNQIANQQTPSIRVKDGAVLSVGFSNLGNPGNLLLVGGDVVIEGSGGSIPNNLGNLQGAPGSDIQVGGFKAGRVGLIFDTDNKLRLDLPETSLPTGVVGANVSLINGAGINLGTETDDAGNILLTGATVSLTGGSFLSSSTFGAGTDNNGSGVAGRITIKARDQVSIEGGSGIFSESQNDNESQYGSIQIDSTDGSVFVNSSTISSTNKGTGWAGIVTITARDQVSILNSEILNEGDWGWIFLGRNETKLFVFSQDPPLPQEVRIDNSKISTTNPTTDISGRAGEIIIRASDLISISGKSQITSESYNDNRAEYGFIQIESTQGSVALNNSIISTTNNGTGWAGAIKISAPEEVSILNNSKISSDGDEGWIFIGKNDVYPNIFFPDFPIPRRVNIANSILSSTINNSGEIAGDIIINALDQVSIDNSQILSTVESGAVGNAGRILIQTGSFSLSNGSRLETLVGGTTTLDDGTVVPGGVGDAGLIKVQARGSVSISDSTYNVDTSTRINSSVELGARGNAGAIYISAGSFELKSAFVTTSTSAQQNVFGQPSRAGAINLYIDGAATLRDSTIFNNLESGAIGEGGGISIAARSLSLLDGAQIQAIVRGPDENDNPGAQGNGGSITINVPGFVNISGQGPDPSAPGQLFSSGLFVNTTQGAIGPAGSITVNTNNLSITGSGFITAETENGSDAGRITLNVNTLEVDNGKISSESSSTGNAGDIVLNVNDRLTVQNNGEISVAGTGTGNPGNLNVGAGYIYLSQGGRLRATSASGRNANINVQVRDSIQMRYNSEISAEAFNNGDGGNITIDAGNIIFAFLQENSDIVANAFEGKGGNVYAKAQGVFGFRQSGQVRTPESEFIASSELGIDGTTEIDSQDKLDESVPINFVDATGLIDRRCTPRNNPQERSSFTITGRGGLPPSPNDILQNDSVESNWVTTEPAKENRTRDDASTNSDESVPSATRVPKTSQFVEAQGWVYGANGEIILTASAPTVTPHSPSVVPDECQGFERSQL